MPLASYRVMLRQYLTCGCSLPQVGLVTFQEQETKRRYTQLQERKTYLNLFIMLPFANLTFWIITPNLQSLKGQLTGVDYGLLGVWCI